MLKTAPRNANAYIWLGYAQRKRGEFDKAVKTYRRALALDSKHRGAHEYLGEAYLSLGQLASAEKLLKNLKRICGPGCEEYRELKEKIEAFATRASQKQSMRQ